jgi:predicted transcriptional regulator
MDLGFCIVPSLLLRAQARLGLNPTQLAVLLHLVDHWWDVSRKPYPSKQRLADRLKLGPRQVQRYIAELEKAGLVQRLERSAPHRGKLSNAYDLSGLVQRLGEFEPDFRQVEEEVKANRRAAGCPAQKAVVCLNGVSRRSSARQSTLLFDMLDGVTIASMGREVAGSSPAAVPHLLVPIMFAPAGRRPTYHNARTETAYLREV